MVSFTTFKTFELVLMSFFTAWSSKLISKDILVDNLTMVWDYL